MDKTNVEMWISIIFINRKSSIFYSFKYFVSKIARKSGMQKNCPIDGENFATFLNNSDIGITKMTLGTNNWDVETYGNKLEKLTELTTYYFNVNWKKLQQAKGKKISMHRNCKEKQQFHASFITT